MQGISQKSGLEVFLQLLQIGRCFLMAEWTALAATGGTGHSPLAPSSVCSFTHSISIEYFRSEKPRVWCWRGH